uniref:THAP-type domain-containing protein n=1 Tax=Myripristis murdjan TaxID=586833 RepID=A0A667YBL2_9TELE
AVNLSTSLLCAVSSHYNKEVSFHAFPVDAAIRAEWMQKIRRDDFNPTKNTRVCSRHFKRLKKGTVPVYFSWNGYKLPAPRPSVWERRPRAEFLAPESDSDSKMETEMAPDHAYCVVPPTGARASNLADENEALRRQIRELQQQLEVLKPRQHFGIERLSASDEDVHFYTRFTGVSWHFGD